MTEEQYKMLLQITNDAYLRRIEKCEKCKTCQLNHNGVCFFASTCKILKEELDKSN